MHANRRTGKLIRRYDTIVKETGLTKRTVRYWLSILKQRGYIEIERPSNSLAFLIQVQKWKPLPKKPAVRPRPADSLKDTV